MRSRRDELSSLWQKVIRGGPSNLIFIRLSFSFLLRIFSDRESKQTINSCEASTAVLSLRMYLATTTGVFHSNRGDCGGWRRRLSHKIPLKAHSLYGAIAASHAAPKAFFSPPWPLSLPPSLPPLFQCIHADLYGLYPPLPSSLSPPLPSLLPLSFTPSISDQVLGLESDPYPGILFHF